MNSNASNWENIFLQKEWGKYPSIALVRFIASNYYDAQDRNEIKILEIGCGTGANLWYLAREGFKVYGVDFSYTACSRLHERFSNEGLTGQIGDIIVGNYLDELDTFEDSMFDIVIDIESLYCNSFEDSKKIVEKCFTKLKKGGVMFSQTFSEGTWGLEGPQITYHCTIPSEGPMKDCGMSRFTTEDDIEKLYHLRNSKIRSIELQELSLNNGKLIGEWLIEVEKD